MSVDYLLGLTKIRRHPNADLADLRLSDDITDILKVGRVDTVLLSELVVHKNFRRLVANTNIYVNRLAAMQVHNLNASTTAFRHCPVLHQPLNSWSII